MEALKRHVLRKAHPTKIFIDTAAWMWAVYFLWANQWLPAFLIILTASTASYVLVRRTNPERMATSTLGRIALLHLHPANLVVQIASLVPLLYGIWTHSGIYILAGLTLLFLGHVWGWDKVDERFAH
jgi:hypothetical protein